MASNNSTGLQTLSPAYPDAAQAQALPQAPMQVQVFSPLPVFDVTTMKKRQKAIQDVKKSVMVQGVHYGVIPGCKKDSLLKPGAEVLCQAFGLIPIIETRTVADEPDAEWCFDVERRNQDTGENFRQDGVCIGYFEIEATCTLYTFQGAIAGRGSARCSNRENKYRTQCMWDVRNTIEQMAAKRSHVGITRTVTGCSDLFDMDIEDLPGGMGQASAGRAVQSQAAGSVLSPKQQESVRSFGKSAGVHARVIEFAIAHVSRGESKAFMDGLFQNKADHPKVASLFEPYLAAARAEQEKEKAADTAKAAGPVPAATTTAAPAEGGAK
jgi:hypothetical protein